MSIFAAPFKRSLISCYTSEYKKASESRGVSVLADGKDKNTGNLIHFQEVQTSLTAVSHYIAGPYSFITVSCYASRRMSSNKAAERVSINQLLHLFPSHYFW
jgi:hypothetical protein